MPKDIYDEVSFVLCSGGWRTENNGFLQARLLGVRSVRWQWVGCIVQAGAVMSRAID